MLFNQIQLTHREEHDLYLWNLTTMNAQVEIMRNDYLDLSSIQIFKDVQEILLIDSFHKDFYFHMIINDRGDRKCLLSWSVEILRRSLYSVQAVRWKLKIEQA